MLVCSSCKTYNMLPYPQVGVTVANHQFTIQNMDNNGMCDVKTLTAHYEGFDIEYSINKKWIMTFTIVNKTGNSLIIDKSKCYVLYDGYSRELFKDVRSGRMTTFNNVQDAINNVQTTENSVTFQIPPYSKWTLPIEECNLQVWKKLPDCPTTVGTYNHSIYDANENVEFVIIYSFDYTLSQWKTSRNRIWIGSSIVENSTMNGSPKIGDVTWNCGTAISEIKNCDYSEYNRVFKENKRREEHNDRVAETKATLLLIAISPIILAGIAGMLYLIFD